MRRNARHLIIGAALLSVGMLAGCNRNYYAVTNLDSGRVFYTKKIKKHRSGSIRFIDRSNGNEVRISNAEIEEISKRQYNRALNDSEIERGGT